MFEYLKHHNSELVLDPSDQVIDQAEFEHQYWTSSEFGHFYGKEDLPPNILASSGVGFLVT